MEGQPQLDLLNKKMPMFRDSQKFSFRVTIPCGTPYVSLRGFLDDLIELIGTTDFRVRYWPENGRFLPDWFDRWIDESYALAISDAEGKYADKLLGLDVMLQLFDMQSNVFRLFNCNAAFGSVAEYPAAPSVALNDAMLPNVIILPPPR